MFKRCIARYGRLLETRPIATKSITAGFLMFSGDIISQTIIEHKPNQPIRINWERNLKMTTIGLGVGPLLHYWYGLLGRYIVASTPTKTAIYQLAFDQILFAPVTIAGFFWVYGIIDRKSSEEIYKHFENNFMDALKMNYIIWPAANFINFRFVPQSYRVLFAGAVSLVWNSFLSNITTKK